MFFSPEDIEIRQITKFSGEGYGKAYVTLRLGDLIVHSCRIMEKDGKRWFALPSRASNEGKWIRIVTIEDDELSREIERLALEAYDSTTALEDEVSKVM